MSNVHAITRRKALQLLPASAAAVALAAPAFGATSDIAPLLAMIEEHKNVAALWDDAWGRYSDAEEDFDAVEKATLRYVPGSVMPDGTFGSLLDTAQHRDADDLRAAIARHHLEQVAKFSGAWAERVSPTAAKAMQEAIRTSQAKALAAVDAFEAEYNARRAAHPIGAIEAEIERHVARGKELETAILAWPCRSADEAMAKALWWMGIASDVDSYGSANGFEPPAITLDAFAVVA